MPACLCRWISPTANEVDVLILQHPQEVRHAKNTVRLLQLSLARCTVAVGETLEEEQLAAWLAQPLPSGEAPCNVLLYPATPPSQKGLEVPPHGPGHPPPACRLVVLDATWRKSLKMLHGNPLLQTLPRLALTAAPAARYRIRKAPRAGQLSTLEATCLALAQLEDAPQRYTALLNHFEGFVGMWQGRQGT